MRAVILAGGRGTRLRPLTDSRPKPLVPFMGAPYATGLLQRLRAVGISEAVFLVGRDAEPFRPLERLDPDVDVRIVTEEAPLDTAGAARRLFQSERTDAPTLVCNGDILTDMAYDVLIERHVQTGATATLALTNVTDTSAFGVVVLDGSGHVERFVEKPEPGTLTDTTINAGTYILSGEAFDDLPGDGPLSFEREVFPGLLQAGRRLVGVASTAHWADLGTPRRFLDGHRAVISGACSWPTPLQRRPQACAVHDSATIANNARLGPNAVIGANVRVADGASVTDSVLFDGAMVESDAVVLGAILGFGASVGPGVKLPVGAVLADGENVEV